MDGSGTLRVEDDQRNRPKSPTSVEGGQASHAPPMNEPELAVRGAIDILQQIALTIDSCHSRVIRNQQNLYPKFLLLP